MSETKKLIALILVCSGLGYALGRWMTPEKVRVETKTVEVKTDDKHTDAERDKHRETTVVEVKKPDGTVERTTKTTEDSQTKKTTDDKTTDSTTAETSKEVTGHSSPVSILALGGVPLGFPLGSPVYGAAAFRPLIGPITVGLWGLSNATGGVAVGLTF